MSASTPTNNGVTIQSDVMVAYVEPSFQMFLIANMRRNRLTAATAVEDLILGHKHDELFTDAGKG